MYLYKYRPINKNTLNSLASNYFYFANPQVFNDPFDSKANLALTKNREAIRQWVIKMSKSSLTQDQIETDIDNILEKGETFFNNDKITIGDRFRILSLSSVNTDIVMWSHYADSHRGICIAYDTVIAKKSLCFLIEPNQIKINNAYLTVGFLPVQKVRYRNNMPKKYDFIIGKDIKLSRFILTKHTNWKYEKEYRSFL